MVIKVLILLITLTATANFSYITPENKKPPEKLLRLLTMAEKDLNNLEEAWQKVEDELRAKLSTIQSSFVKQILISSAKRQQEPIENEIERIENVVEELELAKALFEKPVPKLEILIPENFSIEEFRPTEIDETEPELEPEFMPPVIVKKQSDIRPLPRIRKKTETGNKDKRKPVRR